MPPTSHDSISITQAAKDYPTSRRTIERRREKAHKTGDQETLDAFMIRAKDGSEYHAPSDELVQRLRKDGQQPETYVNKEWLDKHFGQSMRHDDATKRQPSDDDGGGVSQDDAPTGDPLMNAVLQQLKKKDEQIATQNKLIAALTERQRESNVLLSEFQKKLPLATQNADPNPPIAVTPAPEPPSVDPVNTTPKITPVTQKPRRKSAPKKASSKTTANTNSKAKKKPAKVTAKASPSRFSWLRLRR